MEDIKIREIVLGRVQELNNCILCDKTDEYEYAKARLDEALTIAMQLKLIEPTKADAIGAKAQAKLREMRANG